MQRPLRFSKYEGLGNDFIVVEADQPDALPPERAAALCDRRLGIGADGVLLLLPPHTADSAVRMRVINADGSIPEMCGNGVRCVALHVARGGLARGTRVRVDTDAGPRECVLDAVIRSARDDRPQQAQVTVDMGRVRVSAARTLDVDGHLVTVTPADIGNPHAVLVGAFARGDIDRLGPRIATHPDFARGTNVEFARVSDDGIDLVVWERGVGITLACGTGACATAAVARAQGLFKRESPIVVRLPGGPLEVTFDAAGRAIMRGPARHVFSGEIAAEPAPVERDRISITVPSTAR